MRHDVGRVATRTRAAWGILWRSPSPSTERPARTTSNRARCSCSTSVTRPASPAPTSAATRPRAVPVRCTSNGEAVKSCTVLAVQADGQEIRTIEGMADADGTLHPMQQAFMENHGLQCGYCTPGMVMAATQPAAREPEPDRGGGAPRPRRATCAAARATTTSSSRCSLQHRPAPERSTDRALARTVAAPTTGELNIDWMGVQEHDGHRRKHHRPRRSDADHVVDGNRVIGQRMLRKEDPALLTGESVFTNDMKVPGALHLAVLRSPYAHARILSIDTSAARGDAGGARRVHRRRPGVDVGGTDAVRVAGHRRHEEPDALPAGRAHGALLGDGVAVVLADERCASPATPSRRSTCSTTHSKRSSISRTRCPTV